MRATFAADHKTYKRLGVYDFPQRKIRMRVQNTLLGALMKSQGFRRAYYKRVRPGMIAPHVEFLAKM
jgi:hypothetical protein